MGIVWLHMQMRKMMKNKVLITIFALILLCAFGCAGGLGLFPRKSYYSKIETANLEKIKISYYYAPASDLPTLKVSFEIKGDASLKEFQNSIKIKDVSAYTLGLSSSFQFFERGDNGEIHLWKIRFFPKDDENKNKILLSRDEPACVAYLSNGSLYKTALKYAFNNSQKIFKNSDIEKIQLCD